jgi:hypothetical protein
MQSLRKSAPLVLAVLFLLFAAYQLVSTLSSDAWNNPSDEMVTKWEDHVQALKDALPSDLTQIGYMDDSAISGDVAAFDINEFQLMQYSIAPIALDNGIGHSWIIGNFEDDTNLEAWLTDTIGAHEVQSFGFGLYLIHDLEN